MVDFKKKLTSHIKKDDKEFRKQISDVKGQIKDDVRLTKSLKGKELELEKKEKKKKKIKK